jgi:hypothetical protein
VPALVALATAAFVAGVVVVAIMRGGSAPPARPRAPVSAEATFTPHVVLFGAAARADVRVTVDRRRIDPRTVHVSANLAPFELLGAPRVRRSPLGRTESLRVTFRVQCVAAACSRPGSQATVSLAPAVVTWGKPPRRVLVAWAPETVASRLSTADAARPTLHYTTAAPAAGYRVDPNLVGWGAVGVSAALVIGLGGAVAVRSGGRRVVPEPTSSELERALTRLEQTASGSNAERRTAIGALAQALEHDGFAELAPLARRLAWSSGGPTSAVATELAGLVRAAVEVAA